MEEIQIPLALEFTEICKDIIDKHLSESEWSAIESSDMFQTASFVGGYDATENAFTFSYYKNEKEYWFQLTLNDVIKINGGTILLIKGTLADTFI